MSAQKNKYVYTGCRAWSSSRWTGCSRFRVFAFKGPTLRRHTLLNGSAHGLDSGVIQVHPEAASTSPLAALAALQVLQWHAAHEGQLSRLSVGCWL